MYKLRHIRHKKRRGRGNFDGLKNYIHFIKLKYYGNFTYITQNVHSNAHLHHFKGIFSDETLSICVNFKFPRNVFLHIGFGIAISIVITGRYLDNFERKIFFTSKIALKYFF